MDSDALWSSVIFLNFFNVYLFLKERTCKQGRGRERGTHRIQSRLQALSCQHRAQCRSWTHEPWDHDLSWSWMLNWLSEAGIPSPVIFLNVFIYFWERERQHEWGERQRERDTQNPKQAPGSELSAQSLMWASNSQTMRSWPELKSDTQPTEPPRCP